MPGDPVTLDLSQSQPIAGATAQPSQPSGGVKLDLSQSQPVNGGAAPEKPGFLSTLGSDVSAIGKGIYKAATYSAPDGDEQAEEAHKKAVYGQFSSDFHSGQYAKAFSGLAGLFQSADPNEPVSQMIDSQLASSKQAKDRMMEAAKKGDALGVVQHAAGILPIASQVDAAATKFQEEPTAENLAHVVTTGIQAFIPSLMRGAGKLVGAASEGSAGLLTSKAAAGESLGEINAAIGEHPVSVDNAAEIANDILDKQKTGAKLGGAKKQLQQFIDRATDPNEPLTFAEAREFEQNFRNLTPAQKMNMGGGVRPLLRELSGSLRESVEQTADAAGQGDKFRDAMRAYGRAAQTEKVVSVLKNKAVQAGLGVVGGKVVVDAIDAAKKK